MNEVMQHVRTVQKRVNERMNKHSAQGPDQADPVQPSPSHKKAADAKDEREAMTHDANERTDQAESCLRDDGSEQSEVC